MMKAFPSTRVSMEDIRQVGPDDSALIATIAALARYAPDWLHSRVKQLDGTSWRVTYYDFVRWWPLPIKHHVTVHSSELQGDIAMEELSLPIPTLEAIVLVAILSAAYRATRSGALHLVTQLVQDPCMWLTGRIPSVRYIAAPSFDATELDNTATILLAAVGAADGIMSKHIYAFSANHLMAMSLYNPWGSYKTITYLEMKRNLVHAYTCRFKLWYRIKQWWKK